MIFRSLDVLESFYGFGQVSVAYLRDNIRYHGEGGGLDEGLVWSQQLLARENCLNACNLDVR